LKGGDFAGSDVGLTFNVFFRTPRGNVFILFFFPTDRTGLDSEAFFSNIGMEVAGLSPSTLVILYTGFSFSDIYLYYKNE
jgi:hypothetical protein